MNKKLVLYICLFFILVILLIVTFIIVNKKVLNKDKYETNNINETNVTEERHISKDNRYVSNEVIISFKEKTSKEVIEKTLKEIKDIKNTSSIMDGTYVLVFNHDFDNLDDLNKQCKSLKENKDIELCEPNYIIQVGDCSKGPC